MSKRHKGTVASWFDEKGYGFIRPDGGGDDVFVHATDLSGRRRPRIGTGVRYSIAREQGKVRAKEVELAGFGLAPITMICTAFLLGAVGLFGLRFGLDVAIPWPLLVYGGMSVVTWFVYAHDKRRAGSGGRRVPESVLHGLELAGGWPGALFAQQFFRHKSQKRSYRAVFWLIVIIHVGAWSWWWFATR